MAIFTTNLSSKQETEVWPKAFSGLRVHAHTTDWRQNSRDYLDQDDLQSFLELIRMPLFCKKGSVSARIFACRLAVSVVWHRIQHPLGSAQIACRLLLWLTPKANSWLVRFWMQLHVSFGASDVRHRSIELLAVKKDHWSLGKIFFGEIQVESRIYSLTPAHNIKHNVWQNALQCIF